MTEAPSGSLPDPAVPLANFLRNSIRAIAAQNPRRDIEAMILNLTDFQEQLDQHGADALLHQIFDRAIESFVTHDQRSEVDEAKLNVAIAGMKMLADLSSTDSTRAYRLSHSNRQLHEALTWFDELRGWSRTRRK